MTRFPVSWNGMTLRRDSMRTLCAFTGIFFLCCAPFRLVAQSQQTVSKNDAPEFREFDFWLGEWELSWHDSVGRTVHGSNIIRKMLDNFVVHESFSDPTNKLFGQSWSVYNPQRKLWHQTWVDNQGSYMDFTGGMTDGNMILGRSFVGPKGRTVHQRMVFFDITPNSLSWRWESSLDAGKTWKELWLIRYKRKG